MTTITQDSGGGGLVGYRLALRLARREVIRRPGRTLLVALLVALPVAGMTIGAVMLRTGYVTPLQYWHEQFGNADAAVGSESRTALPASRTIDWHVPIESRLLRTADSHRSSVSISTLPMADPMTSGIYVMMSGRAPTKVNEVFLTRAAAHQLDVGAGDTLRLVRPAVRSLTVTGIGEDASGWGAEEMVLPPGVPYPWKAQDFGTESGGRLIDFTGHPSTAELSRLRFSRTANGSMQISPALLPSLVPPGSNDTNKKVAWSWVVGALVLTVVGIVIAAAFAVGARRQLVTLGQLAGNGAAPKVLRRVLFLQGTLTGIVGALGGVTLGAAALALLAPHVDQIFGRAVDPYVVRPTDVVPIILIGVVTATLAALVPARALSRVPVLAALAGRRPLGRVPRWLPVAGACVAAGGLGLLGLAVLGARDGASAENVWLLTASVGGVAVLLGACAFAPFYVSVLEPAAARSRGSWRVATRSLARQRTRTSAVVSAIAATCALAIAGSGLFLSARYNDREPFGMRPDEAALFGGGSPSGPAAPRPGFVAAAEKALPHSDRFQVHMPVSRNVSWKLTDVTLDDPTDAGYIPLASGGEIYPSANGAGTDPSVNVIYSVGVADRALIDHYGLSQADQHALTEHGALVLATVAGHATIAAITHVARGKVAPKPRTVDAPMVDGHEYRIESLPSVLLTPAKVADFGMTVRPSTVVLRSPRNVTTDQRNEIADAANDANTSLGPDTNTTNLYNFFYPPKGPDPLVLEWLLVGVALVLTLFVVAVNLALSATETRDERDVLTVIGAAPGTLSRTNGYKAALLTVMGAVLAVPVGLLPVAVFLKASGPGNHLVFPLVVLTLLLIAVPVAAGIVTAATSAVLLRVRPVRISTMAFD